MNKILLILVLMICFSSTAFAQKTKIDSLQDKMTIDSLQTKIENLEKIFNDKNYSRVPNVDFDRSLDYLVSEKVSSKILYWIGGLAFVVGLLGYSFINNTRKSLKSEADKDLEQFKKENKTELSDNNNRLEKKLKEQNESLISVNDKQDKNITELSNQVKSSLEGLKTFQQQILETVNERINKSLKTVWNDVANARHSKAVERKFNGQDLIEGFKDILENEAVVLSNNTKVSMIDDLMRCYYLTISLDKRERYKQMIELLKKYEKEFELLPETYANAAIALNDNYEFYGTQNYFEECIRCCDKSIERLPDYGVSYAVKLDVLLINYEKAYNDEERKDVFEKIKRIFNSIEKNQSDALCPEILERFELDKKSYLKTYIESLEKLFYDELLRIKERVCNSIIPNKGFLESYNDKVINIMEENAKLVVNLNGEWKAIKSINKGEEQSPDNLNIKLIFNNYNFEFKSPVFIQNGYSLFLPYKNKKYGINFYINKDGNYDLVQGIYSYKNNKLTLCMNYSSIERPDEFSSNNQNNYLLEEYEKIS